MEIKLQNSKLSELMEDDNLRLQIEADSERLQKSISELNEVYNQWQLSQIESMIYYCEFYCEPCLEVIDLLNKIKNNITEKYYYHIDKIQQNLLNEFYSEKISAHEFNEKLKDYKRFKKTMEAINGR